MTFARVINHLIPMKFLLLSLAIYLTASYEATAQGTPSLSTADKAAIETTLHKFEKYLNDHQFAEMPTYTTPDISFVNIVGMYWQGEPNVQHAHQAIFDRIYKGVAMPPADSRDVTLRAITPDVVLATCRIIAPVRSDVAPPADAPPAGSGRTMLSLLLVKRQGQWLITAGQNTVVDARAAASNPIK